MAIRSGLLLLLVLLFADGPLEVLLNGLPLIMGYLINGALAIPVWLARSLPANLASALAILMELLGPRISAD